MNSIVKMNEGGWGCLWCKARKVSGATALAGGIRNSRAESVWIRGNRKICGICRICRVKETGARGSKLEVGRIRREVGLFSRKSRIIKDNQTQRTRLLGVGGNTEGSTKVTIIDTKLQFRAFSRGDYSTSSPARYYTGGDIAARCPYHPYLTV
jgi:hypothetical protein